MSGEFDGLPATRKEAKLTKSKFYFTGEPCVHGHVDKRYTSICMCASCHRVHTISYRKAHPDRDQAATKRWLKKNPEKAKAIAARKRAKSLDKEYARAKKRYAANKELAKQKAQAWYFANLERAKANAARWRKDNKEAVLVACHSRRAKMKASPGSGITVAEIRALASYQLGCPDCKKPFSKDNPYTLDHIMPIALGGAHDKSNIELRCYSCNNAKRAQDPFEYARSLGRLL